MNILETLKKTKESFDPRKDNINQPSGLPAGEYAVRLKSSNHEANPYTKREEAKVVLEVISGNHKNMLEFINLNFDDDLPEFVIDKNAKILLTLAEYAGVEFTESELQSEQTIAEALKRGIGKQFKMTLKLSPNKKNPEYPYRNYEFSEMKNEFSDDPFAQNESEIGESDIPF